MEKSTVLINVMQMIRDERLKRRWSQSRLAIECGWDNAAGRISNYENLSREPTLADLDRMATALEISLERLLLNNLAGKGIAGFVQLPLISMSEIINYSHGNLTDIKGSVNMYIASIDVSQNLIAVTVEGDAMENKDDLKKSICDGDVVAINLTLTPSPRDIVIAEVNGETKIREYNKDGTEELLKAFNPRYANISINPNVKILAVVTDRFVQLKYS